MNTVTYVDVEMVDAVVASIEELYVYLLSIGH